MQFIKAALSVLATLGSLNLANGQNIVEIASGADDFSTLTSLVVQAGLADTLSGSGPFLVYAPTNDAFAELPPGVVDFLLDDMDQLVETLAYHVIVGGSVVNPIGSDIAADNGIIRVIDTVLVPSSVSEAFSMRNVGLPNIVETAISAGSFGTLVTLVSNAGLVDALSGPGPLTVFAPTDDAFAKLDSSVVDYLLDEDNVEALQSVLTYHVVSGQVLSTDLSNGVVPTLQGQEVEIRVGSNPTVNNANIVATDIMTSNGVIHVIDEVLVPPGFTIPRDVELPNIVETAISAGSFGTLVTLVSNAGLVDALSGSGPLTVFAPNDNAFANLDSRVVNYLLDEDNVGDLQSVLTYHVVSGQVLSTDLSNGYVPTLQGQDVEIRVAGPTVNDVNIIAADIMTSNGVIHVIDEVLLPPGFSIPGIDCVYMGRVYDIFEWAIGPTHVCQCVGPNWRSCQRLDSTCGRSCSSDGRCGGHCGNCDFGSGMCVPFN